MTGMTKRIAMVSTLVVAAAVGYATPASAQATRTWVSGVGDAAFPCSRTAPCQTFAGAISKTAAGGEINCLDPGGYGAVSITKSMTISCPYTEGGALAGGNGITVNDALSGTPNTAVVFLRGLDIFGVNPPTHGVRFVSGGALHIEDTTIRRFNAASSRGVSFQPAGAAKLYMSNVTIAENGFTNSGGGILIQPTGTGSATVAMRNVRVKNNGNEGVTINSTSNTGPRNIVVIDESEIHGSLSGLAIIAAVGVAPANVVVTRSMIVGNGTGISANGGLATLRASGNTITGNTLGLSIINSAAILSYGDNILDANPDSVVPNNGTFTGAIILKK